jgi:peptidoglycan/LPS O-acetylase OafA/YrhL
VTATSVTDVAHRDAPEAPSPAVSPPPGNPRFALIDSLRGIAVLSVLTFHVASISGALTPGVLGDLLAVLGDVGLVLFFVISGFLLYRPFVAAREAGRRPPRTARYARRRVLRIVPAYWVALTALAIFPGIVGPFSGDWWRYYFFGQLYSQRTVGGGIPVAWTLCVEVSFYVLLPIWARAIRRLRLGPGPRALLGSELLPLALLAGCGLAVQIAASRLAVSRLVSDSLAGQCTWFALGMALAVASVAVGARDLDGRLLRAVNHRSALCWVGAAACLAGLAAVLRPGGGFAILLALTTKQPLSKTLPGLALTAGLVVLLVAPAVFGQGAGGLPRRVLAAAPLALLGLISYGVYLWHLTIAELLGMRSARLQFSAHGLNLVGRIHTARTPILFVLTLVLSCAIAALSYRFVELPFLRRKEA